MAMKDDVIREMRRHGCRITEQRKLLVEIILRDAHLCCKEIYYEARKQDASIGMATVYRTISTLQDIGVLRRDQSRPVLSQRWGGGGRCRIMLAQGEQARKQDEEALYGCIRNFLTERGYLRSGDFQAAVMME